MTDEVRFANILGEMDSNKDPGYFIGQGTAAEKSLAYVTL